MTIHSHIAELERKHRALDDELAEAMAHPSTDDTKIAELKRRNASSLLSGWRCWR